jgi:hypothetical protein
MEYADTVTVILEYLKHFSWPIVVLIAIVVFGPNGKRAIEALAVKIADPDAAIGITKDGIEIRTAREDLQTQIDTLKNSLAEITENVQKTPDPKSEVQKLAVAYLHNQTKSRRERTREKSQLAIQIGSIIESHRLDREALIAEENEGYFAGIAAAATTFPKAGDTALLLKVAEKTDRLHVKYLLCQAFSRLAYSGYLKDRDIKSIREKLQTFSEDADKPLQQRIDSTRKELVLTKLGYND